MKKIGKLLLLLTVIGITAGCESDDELSHTKVTPVTDLYAPEENAFFFLGAQSTAVFEWQAAKAEDNGVVLYEVVFDKPEGDFSDPLYTIPSDGRGLQPALNLSFSDLNKIAIMAGIQPEGTGELKWTVLSSKGINVQEPQVSRVITVERPAGFPPPDELYLTGSATEAGAELGDAIRMKKTGESTFEVYTVLKEGEYYFAERNSGEPPTYFIEGDKLAADGEANYTGEEKLYRIRLDFSNGTTKVEEIEILELWFPPFGEFLFELPYTGNGTWEATDKPIEFDHSVPWNDERYKFRMKVKTAEGTVDEWYGSTNADNQRPTDESPDSYWYMVDAPDDDWTNTFKFHSDVDGKNVNIKVIFNTSVPEYTHTVTIVE